MNGKPFPGNPLLDLAREEAVQGLPEGLRNLHQKGQAGIHLNAFQDKYGGDTGGTEIKNFSMSAGP